MFLRALGLLNRWSPAEAHRRILAGKGSASMRVDGTLDFSNDLDLKSLPPQLTANTIDLRHCTNLKALPPGLRCEQLILRGTNVEWLPPDLAVAARIDARDCRRLRKLPPLAVRELLLSGCTALEELPAGLTVHRLDVSGCTRLEEIPAGSARPLRHLRASDCTSLVLLPEELVNLEDLDVAGCVNLDTLPEGMKVRSWIEVAGTALTGLPWSLRSVRVHWRGVPVPDHIAFDPGSITAKDILHEPNLALRRVLLERIGIERFVRECRAEVLDCDQDAGGERRLLRIRFDADEDLVCVAVQCPSTGHRYVLRVPPQMRTCRQAVAWTAGFTDPADYRPAVET
jgi:hypothetical protein